MKLTRTVRFNPAFFPLAPAVNVLFLVFMLFAMSSRFVLQPGISVSLPLSSFTLAPPFHAQIVSVTAAPSPEIYFHGRRLSLQELLGELGPQATGQRSLVLKADRNTPYDLVSQITNQALRRGYSVILAGAPEPQS